MFVDTIIKTYLVDGAVRLEMGTLEPVEGEKGKLRPSSGEMIVTTLPGLVRIREQLDTLIGRLEAEGLLRRTEQKPPAL